MMHRRWAGLPVEVRYSLLYLAVSLASSWPVLLGYVPLPVELIVGTPLWASLQDQVTYRQFGVMEDLVRSFYPGHKLIGEALRAGTIPLWNPYVLNGYPMHAALAMAIFAPFTLLFAVLPADLAWTLGMVLKPVIAALGTALYARALGLRHSAALGAGFVFAWCGFQAGWAGQAMVDVSIWLPWVLLGVLRVAEAPTAAKIALTAVALAFAAISGHPEISAYVALMAAAQATVCLFWPRRCATSGNFWLARLTALASLSAVAVLSGLLSAVQLLPTAEWIPQLKRELVGISDPMPGFYILDFVVRQLAAVPANVVGALIPNGAMYAGLVTLLLVPAALTHQPRREVWLHVLVVLAAVQFAFGWGPLGWLQRASPIQVDFPKTRIILVADFSLAMLAGFGIAALTGSGRRLPPWQFATVTLETAGATIGLAALLVWLPDAGPAIDRSLDPFSWPRFIFQGRAFSLALVVATALALAIPPLVRRARPSGFVLCTLLAVDLLTFAYGHVPFAHTDALLTVPPAVRFLQEHVSPSERVLATKNVIPYNWEAQFRLATPSGYLYITRMMVDVMAPITIGPDPGIIELRLDRLIETRSPLIDFLGVRYLVSGSKDGSAAQLAAHPERFTPVYDDGSVTIFENRRVLPRTYLVPCVGIEVQEFQRRAISRVNSPAFDPATAVILDDKIRCPEAPRPAGASPAGNAPVDQPIHLLDATFNTYAVRADVAIPSLLVFADTYYVGWRAFVDGAEVPIERANHAFKAVRVDPGQHTVRFVFDPWSFKLGAILSIIGLLCVVALLGWSALRRRLPRHSRSAPNPSLTTDLMS